MAQIENQEKARQIVISYIQKWIEEGNHQILIQHDDIWIVWYVRSLQNWKCILGSSLPDGVTYEVTYDGDKAEYYLDVHKKIESVVYKEE